jgi:hypothetical protein
MGSLEKRVAEATGGAKRDEEEPERASAPSDAPGPQEGAQRCPWWRRVFGG